MLLEMKINSVFGISVLFLGVQGSQCPAGYHYTDENRYCCKPVKCAKDHQFHLCTENLGSDTCTPCEKGLINPDEINTKAWAYERDGLCLVPDCKCSAPDSVIYNPKECSESGRPLCVCNRQDGYYGHDPLNCNRANSSLIKSAMEKGVELTQDGIVRPCPPGYFKSQYGDIKCNPHSKCPQGFTVDMNGTMILDTICKRSLSSSVPTTPTSFSNGPDLHSAAVESDIWIGISIIVAVVVICCPIIFVIWMKRRQKFAKGNDVEETVETTINLINEEQRSEVRNETNLTLPKQMMATPNQDSFEEQRSEVRNETDLTLPKQMMATPNQDSLEEQRSEVRNETSLTLPKQMMATPNQDSLYQGEGSSSADHEEEKDDQKGSLLNGMKPNFSSESTENQKFQDDAQDSLPVEVGKSLSMNSLLESLPNSEITSREEESSDFHNISVAQENSYERHSMTTSTDFGIGLSTDFRIDNEIQKPGQKQGKKEQQIHHHQ